MLSWLSQHKFRAALWLSMQVLALVLVTGIAEAQQPPAAPAIDIATAPAVLVVISDPGCPYCARWERDVAPGYEASEDGKLFPLARRDRRAPDVAFIPRIVYSPTFVMLVRGQEVGRIVGYSGSELHWSQLAALIEDARAALQRTGG